MATVPRTKSTPSTFDQGRSRPYRVAVHGESRFFPYLDVAHPHLIHHKGSPHGLCEILALRPALAPRNPESFPACCNSLIDAVEVFTGQVRHIEVDAGAGLLNQGERGARVKGQELMG